MRWRHLRARGPASLAVVAATTATLLAPTVPAAAEVAAVSHPVTWTGQRPAGWPAPPPASARAYILMDARTGQVLAERDADDLRIVASTVKLLTVVTALQTLDMDDEVVVGPAAAVGGAATSTDPGERRTVAELVDAVLVRSGNDAALALAEAAGDGDLDAFVAQMNAVAAELGLEGAEIEEPTGLDDSNRLSARHLATVARAALADDRVRASASQPVVDLPDLGSQENRNLLVGSYPGATGLKTGFTTLAGHCLVASAERDGVELVAVVLGAREDPARFDEASALLDLAFDDLAAAEHAPLRARVPGAWQELLPGGRTWVPAGLPVEVELAGEVDDFRVTWSATDVEVGAASASITPPSSSSTGGAVAATLYRSMRRGHVADLWPDGGGRGTSGASSG